MQAETSLALVLCAKSANAAEHLSAIAAALGPDRTRHTVPMPRLRFALLLLGVCLVIGGVLLITIADAAWGPAVVFGGFVVTVFTWPGEASDGTRGPGWEGTGPSA